MSNVLVGLENLPNAYIEKITVSNHNRFNSNIAVELSMHDIEKDGFFVWSDDDLIMSYMKVAIIATSNQQLINGITSGTFSPLPSIIRRGPFMTDTSIVEIPAKKFKKVNNRRSITRKFYRKESILVAEDTLQMTLFVFAYVDSDELSKALRITLTGPLKQYYGAIKSENVFVGGQIEQTSFLYKERDGTVWSGPIHEHNGKFMGGSYHTSEPHPTLTRESVLNTKIIDKRSGALQLRPEINFKNKPLFSELSTSYTNEADLIGMFSVDMRTLVLTKTKHGRKMFNVSKDLFESFAKSVSINSLEIRRQQVRLKVSNTKLGTRKFGQKLVGSYRTVATSVENDGRLVDRDNISQIFITPDKLIKSYQFTDEEMTERTRGEFRYEVAISFSDSSEVFLINLLDQMEKNVSELKVKRELLFRPQRYDRDNNRLVIGTEVPAIFESAIENYYQNLSIVYNIDDEEKAQMIENKKKGFKSDNYTNNDALNFISDYSDLLIKIRNRFDIQKKTERLTGAKKPSKAIAPGMIITNHVFKETVKFDNVVASYDFLGIQSNKSLVTFTKAGYEERANMEASRFFDTSRSSISEDLADLDPEDMMAIQDLDSAKMGFLSPLSFKFKSENKDLTSLQNLDSNGISLNFISHVTEKQSDPKFSSSAVPRKKNIKTKRPKFKRRRSFKNKRIGRTKLNFKRIPFKINNLKVEEYLEVAKYLGVNSEMVNVETKLDESVVAQETQQVKTKLIATQGISIKREKISYDLQSKNNIFEKFKSSPKFDRKKLKMMPIPIKALINSRSTAAKNNILQSESDILKDSETKISTEMIFHTSQKVEYLSGYEMDLNGTPDVSQPIWREVDPTALSNNKRLMCRLRYVEMPELDIKPAKELMLLAQNSIFIISDENINTLMSIDLNTEQDLEIQQSMSEAEEIVFASSNLVKQSQERKSNMILSRQQISQQTQQSLSPSPQRSPQTNRQPTGGRPSAPISSY
tara:strand:- start:5468 stop:8410 length:2943 start_codon:yes stop_codon:yes gene_type:complete